MNTYKIGESDTRPWGTWKVIGAGNKRVVKEITVNPNEILSLQKHTYRSEHWIVVEGQAIITIGDNKYNAKADEHFYIPKQSWHRIHNNGDTTLTFIEVQTGDILDESDIERKDDKYNRT